MLYRFLIAFLFFSSSLLYSYPKHAVTNEEGGGRFGDKLLTYLRAKWISYKYNIPFFYRPFDYSTKLVLHKKETRLKDALKRKNYRVVSLQQQAIDLTSNDLLVYGCPYFPDDPWEVDKLSYYSFEVDWKDPVFRESVLRMIAPQKELRLIHPPEHTVNIALHIREGGGIDADQVRLELPMKLPPLTFYLEGLTKVLSLFPDQAVTCHLFTDAKNPDLFIEELKKIVPANTSVTFTYREVDNSPNVNVLEDFFSLFQFDCLIRPHSHFSTVPSLLHDYAVTYSPVGFTIENGRVTIDQTNLEIDESLYQTLRLKKIPR